VRAVLGHEHDRLHGRDAALLHTERYLRLLSVERPLLGDEAGVQHDDARVPGLRWRRRVWRGDAGMPAGGRVWAVLGHQRDGLHRRDARLRYGGRRVRAVHVQRAVRGHDTRVQHDDAHVPGLRGGQ